MDANLGLQCREATVTSTSTSSVAGGPRYMKSKRVTSSLAALTDRCTDLG
jgi:hypothetical protein